MAICIWIWGDGMATSVVRELTFDYGEAKTYFTCTACSPDVSVLGVNMCVRKYWQQYTGYAEYNDTAKEVLFPNATAHPYKMDLSYYLSSQSSSSTGYISFEAGGTEITRHSVSTTPTQHSITDATPDITKSSVMRYVLYLPNNWNALVLSNPSCKLYFWLYDFMAGIAGNGVKTASVSSATGYEGDSITYSVTLKSGAVWHGWYSDAACTQLVSTDQTYTVTAVEDMSLYAYATHEVTSTGLWLKRNAVYTEVTAVWKKLNGSWQQVSAADVLSGGDNIHHDDT